SPQKFQVSMGSGEFVREPRWRADSKELYYMMPAPGHNSVMGVQVGDYSTHGGLPKFLFEYHAGTVLPQFNDFSYAPSSDGQRFIVQAFSTNAQPRVDVLLNWPTGSKK